MMALPPQASNQKLVRLPLKSAALGVAKRLLALLFTGTIAPAPASPLEEEPLGSGEYERKEPGVN
jgi:hypothetical protein